MPKGFLGRVSVSGMSTLLWWSRSTSTWAEVVSGHDKMDPGKLPAKVHITFFGLSTHQCTKNSTMGLLAIGRYSVWLMPQTPKQLQFRVLEISSEARNPRPLCSWSCCGRLVLQFHLVRSWNSTHFPIARYFFTLRGPKGYDSFVFSATGVFREFFTKPLMIDLTVGGSEKAGQIIVQAGKTLLTPCCSFLLRGVEKRSRPVLRFLSRRIRLLPQVLPAEIERALCRGSCWHKTWRTSRAHSDGQSPQGLHKQKLLPCEWLNLLGMGIPTI